jgi:hypothetical protein
MGGVALFVDHENVFIGLKELLGLRNPDRTDAAAKAAYQSQNQSLAATLAAGLRREAEKLGPIRVAYAVANFQQFDFFHHPSIYAQCGFEPRYNVAGRNSADTYITNLVHEVVADARYSDIDQFVLVSGDGGYFYAVKMLLDQQRVVRLWGVSGHTSQLMQSLAGLAPNVEFVDRLVDFTAMKLAAAVNYRVSRNAGNSAPPAAGPAPAPGPPAHRPAQSLSDLQVLTATFDEFLASSRLDFLSPRLFVEFLEKHRLGGGDESGRQRYLQEALQIGVVKEEKVWLGDREGLRILPNTASDVVGRYRQVRDALFSPVMAKPLHPTDSFRPKRSFIVSSVLKVGVGLEADEVHRWLDWFVHRGALTSTYERLPKDLQPANILKMNPEHPLVQAMLARAMWDRIAMPLLVLSVDCLLRTPPRPWVALSLLLRHIGDVLPVSREELRVAVGQALQAGLLVKKEYPNPRRPEPTSGVHLGEAPQVQETLGIARDFLCRSVELAKPTGQVPISFLIQQCAAAGLCGADYEAVKDWITILEKAGLLLLRGVPHPALAGQTMTVVSPDGQRSRLFLGSAPCAAAIVEAPATPEEPPPDALPAETGEPQSSESHELE